MAEIELSPGTLPPPACYATEQARFDAYVAAIIAEITGGIEWDYNTVAPTELGLYWLRKDGSGAFGRPIEPLKWSPDDGTWVRFASEVISTGTSGGVANAYTLTNTPAMTGPTAMRPGQIYGMFVAADNTAASTLNIDGVGAFPIRYPNDATAVVSGDLVTGQGVILMVNQAGNAFLLLSPPANTAVHGNQLIVTPGTSNFTVPGGVFELQVEVVGGGGGGDFDNGAWGGGGGGYGYKLWKVTPGDIIPCVVGVGGSNTTVFGGAQNTDGGDTSFNTTQIGNGGQRGSSGGNGGGYMGSDYGFSGSNGTRVIDGTVKKKFAGGFAAFAASQSGWATDGVAGYAGQYGGGGAGDRDAGDNDSSAGGAGLILIKW